MPVLSASASYFLTREFANVPKTAKRRRFLEKRRRLELAKFV